LKITNLETIQAGEKEFIDAINAELDWEAIETMLFEKHKFTLEEDVDYRKGDIVVHNDKIAYKLEFYIKVPLSIVLGRDGTCLEISTSGGVDRKYELENDAMEEAIIQGFQENGCKTGNENISGMVSTIAGMISDINHGDE